MKKEVEKMAKRINRLPVDFGYLTERFKEEGVTQKSVSEMLEKESNYLAYHKARGDGLTNDDILKLRDLMEIDMKKLVPRGDTSRPSKPEEPDLNSKAIDVLFQEIAQLRNEIERLEKKMEEPTLVAIPMQPQEMATRVLGELLEGGWCTKDDVIVEFNKHHIPMQYLPDALHAHNAETATAGHANTVKTYIFKKRGE